MKQLLRIGWSMALLLTLGCSSADTVEVSGSITWEGAPVSQGDIMFFSLDPHIPAAAGKISEGNYAFRSKPGNKRVEIRSYRLSDKKTPQGRPIGEMYIPGRYNSESKLTADVTQEGDNRFDFNLLP